MIIQTNFKNNLVGLVRYLWRESIYAVVFSAFVYYLYDVRDLDFLASFSFVPVSLFATILSVFLAFRNNSAYDRWWEARKLWGQLVNVSRMFGAQVVTFLRADAPEYSPQQQQRVVELQQELIFRHIASINLMRMQLRKDINYAEVDPYLNAADRQLIRNMKNPACALFAAQGIQARNACSSGLITDYRFVSLMGSIEQFYDIIGGCERIKNTPFPKEYDSFVRYLIWILITITPIYLLGIFADDLSKLLIIPSTLGITLIVGFANKAGEMLEDPFENRIHDIPMTTLCDKIESDLRNQLGEIQLPTGNETQEPKPVVVW